MSYYADLDVSTIDELPPGRTPIVTKLVADTRPDEIVDERLEVLLDAVNAMEPPSAAATVPGRRHRPARQCGRRRPHGRH
jgi:hypothetical protein